MAPPNHKTHLPGHVTYHLVLVILLMTVAAAEEPNPHHRCQGSNPLATNEFRYTRRPLQPSHFDFALLASEGNRSSASARGSAVAAREAKTGDSGALRRRVLRGRMRRWREAAGSGPVPPHEAGAGRRASPRRSPTTLSPAELGAGANEVVVRNESQLRAALLSSNPILVVATIVLTEPLPNVSRGVVMRGHATVCKDTKFNLCRIDGRGVLRQFVVGRGGQLQMTLLMLSRGYTRVGSGGAMLLQEGGTAILNQVYFRGNSAFGTIAGGGAVEVETGGKLYATESHFVRNVAGFGGAIAAAEGSYVSLYGCIFHRNMAATAGGAVSLMLNTQAVILRSQLTANQAGQGGAIHVDTSTMVLCNATYFSNNATLMAPNILGMGFAKVTICNVERSSIVLTGHATSTVSCDDCKG
eukprot:TRINITY_DN6387_c0_g1_i3.p1 TRINITY_DN6387_c0_g1~~TRINITY_DN6387_c0_g1_i3.p1  ORF type:complete len:413 (-),score=6.71 TRINITY_DN6387_c0_g1_i3:129-1367(-)